MKKIWLIIVITIVILAGFILKTKPGSINSKLTIGNKVTIAVTLADTNQKRTQGYSNHPQVGYDEGLLFVFDKADLYPFWMKDMLFDLDFIFIRDNRVVYLLKNIKAPVNNQGEIEYAMSQEPFDQLLEVRSGFIDKYKINLQDSVKLE